MDAVLKITNAVVIDIKRRKDADIRDLYLGGDGRILDKPKGGDPSGLETIDASGKYVMPGLVDGHVHAKALLFPVDCPWPRCTWHRNAAVLSLQEVGAMMLRAGVTAYLDMGSRPQAQMLEARDQQRQGRLGYDSPDIYTSVANFTAKWGDLLGYPGEPRIGTAPSDHILFLEKDPGGDGPYVGRRGRDVKEKAGEISRLFEPLLQQRPDVVKLSYSLLTDTYGKKEPALHLDTIKAMADLARRYGLPVVVHSETPQGHAVLIGRGVNALTHLAMFNWSRPSAQRWHDLDLADSRIYVVPTLSLTRSLPELRRGDLTSPFLRDILGTIGRKGTQYLEQFKSAFDDRSSATYKFARWRRKIYAEGVNGQPSVIDSAKLFRKKTLSTYEAQTQKRIQGSKAERDGLVIVAGSDAQNYGVVFGFALHQELKAMVRDVGFSTWEALEAATISPGEMLGVPYGVDQGDIANLLVLHENPVTDIGGLQQIHKVIHRSRVVFSDS